MDTDKHNLALVIGLGWVVSTDASQLGTNVLSYDSMYSVSVQITWHDERIGVGLNGAPVV